MKITKIESLVFADLPRLLFVRVHTDEGLIGLGETYDKAPAARAALHDAIAPLLLGNDPCAIARLWNTCFDTILFHGHAGAELRALSAVDIALWDLLGKALGVPVYQVLGGAVRTSIRTYNTAIGHPPLDDYRRWRTDAGRLAEELAADGITGIKIWPFDRFTERTLGQSILNEEIDEGLIPVQSIRDAVGSDFRIGIECHSRFRRAAAEQVCRALEPFGIAFIEDPIPALYPEEIKLLSRSIRFPVVGSETLLGRGQIRDWITGGVSQIVMTDIAWAGGLTEGRRIANLAEAFGLPLTLHNAGGPVAHMACAHLAAHISNVFDLELVRAFYRTYFREISDVEVSVHNGFIRAPTSRPGLGVELLPAIWSRKDLDVVVTEGDGQLAGLESIGDIWQKRALLLEGQQSQR